MRERDFERLYDQHAQRLFAFLAYRTGDRALAEDLLADTFEAAYRARKRFDPTRGSAPTWLYAIALNRLRDHARRQATEQRAMDRIAGEQSAAPSRSELDRVEEREVVARALGALSEQERECVALRFGADLTLREIAATLGQPTTMVESRLYRALRRLRSELE